jgi:cytochrome c biogenesis protein CcdA
LPEQFTFLAKANAENAQHGVQYRIVTHEEARLYIMISVFIVLGITFAGAILAVFITTNREILKWAIDTIKTLMGFFIGVATAFVGIPVAPRS